MKRFFDFILALLLLILLSPLFLIIYLAVWMETGLNPIFVQQRGITFNGTLFRFYKFRTMHRVPDDAERYQNSITLKYGLDGYVTRFGKYLRKSGLDELPQLFNILKGDMSFVGPRPLQISDIELLQRNYPDHYTKRTTIKSRPGITGYWQVFGDRLAGVKNLIEMELYYEHSRSLLMDLFILVETVPVILFARHFDAIISFRKEDVADYNRL
ncbi:MAG TPA: sugar transferase [Ignavibacteriaceae bacterium]|nr:sugar transferase [Ignavibacteriaceae bacterium]